MSTLLTGRSFFVYGTSGRCGISPYGRFAAPLCRAGRACPAESKSYRAAGHLGPALRTILRPLRCRASPTGGRRGGRPCPPAGDGVLPWSAAEQMPLGYAVPSARRCRAARPPLGGGCRRSRLGERKPCGISPSASASRCHLPRRGRQGETDSHASVRTGSE